MEDSQILWKDFIILREGPYWVVRNSTRYVGGTFTTLTAAKRYIDGRVETDKLKEYTAGLNKIKKMPIKNRKKEYEKLCQTLNISSPLSQAD